MQRLFYEMLGRYSWWHQKRNARRWLRDSRVRYGAVVVLAVGVIAAGAVLARAGASPE